MSKLKDISGVPRNIDTALRTLLEGLREHVRSLTGLDGRGQAVNLTENAVKGIVTDALAAFTPSTGGTGGSGTTYTPDYTEPPSPSGVVVTAGLSYLHIDTDAATFTAGHGYERTVVYGTSWPVGGTQPTFADAVKMHEFIGTVTAIPVQMNTQYAVWLKWVSQDGVLSASPSGGANGFQATTGKIGNSDLGALIVQAGNLAAGAIDASKFAAAIEPITLYTSGSLPTTKSTSTIFYGGKLYRWNGTAYVTTVPTTDLSGTITSTQIADGAITTPKLFAGSVTTSILAAHAVTANEIAANTITANELAAASVTAVKLAANSIAVGTAAIQNGAIVNAMLANATIDDAKVANLSAAKLTAGDGTIGGNLKSSNYSNSLATGWIIRPDGYAEFNNVVIRGATYTGTIYANAGTIGGITIASGYMRAGQLGFDNGSGFYLGSDGRLSLGVSTGQKISFDGTNLTIKADGLTIEGGSASFSGALSAATGSFAGALNAATGTFSGSLTAAAVNAVNTINIADEAVIVPTAAALVSDFTSNSVSSSTKTAVLTSSINTQGAPLFITGSVKALFASGVSGVTVTGTVYIEVNGSTVWSASEAAATTVGLDAAFAVKVTGLPSALVDVVLSITKSGGSASALQRVYGGRTGFIGLGVKK